MKVKKAKKILTDSEFVAAYLELEGNKSALGRKIGFTRQYVGTRCEELAEMIAAAQQAHEGGQVAAFIERTVPQKQARQQRETKQAVSQGFVSGAQEAARQFHIFDRLEDMFLDIETLLGDVKSEISATKAKGRSIKPFHIDQMCKLVNQQRGLAVDAHKIKLDLMSVKRAEEFMAAVLAVFLEYDPDVRRKIYVKLAERGLGGQITLIDAGQ